MSNVANWTRVAEDLLPATIALRREIHSNPELGLHCPQTAHRIRSALSGLPLEIRAGSSTSGLVAILRGGGAGRTVLLRADMDALPMEERTGFSFTSRVPGRMHACGHDVHTAMLVASVKALSARQSELHGTVVFMFQPGEEGWHGARHMLEDGLLDEPTPDGAFALHVLPTLGSGIIATRPGAIMASSDRVAITVNGRGAHAAMPYDGRDPVPVACSIVLALQALLARRVPTFDPAVLTIASIAGGSAYNVIPDQVKLLGTVRTLSESVRGMLHREVERVSQHVALAHDMTAQCSIEKGFPVTVNASESTDLVAAIATSLGGSDAFHSMTNPLMASEDFSYVLQKIPGALSFLGAAPEGQDPRTAFPLHSDHMSIDEGCMARGTAFFCAIAEEFLRSDSSSQE